MNRLITHLTKIWKHSGQTLYRKNLVGNDQLEVDSRLATRLRNVLASLQSSQMDDINMESLSNITPPDTVKGMTQLRREEFTKVVKIPAIKIAKYNINKTKKVWKNLQLKIREINPFVELGDNDPDKQTHRLILLDPDKLQTDKLSEDQKLLLQEIGLDFEKPNTFEVKLQYNNWTFPEVMRAILPSDSDNVTSFTQIGHIAHLNLKEVALPYKLLIGEVILDKISTVKTVVNKLNSINSTYRNFEMDLLAGEQNYITQIKEHGCTFELDFSKVYWNSRLASEHQKIVDLIEKDSIVYDVFAGIGPFAVPLANKKRRCHVFANDLNPASFEYLEKNIQLNKIVAGRIQTYNMDGREFIKTVVKKDLVNRIIKDGNIKLSKAPTLEAVDKIPGDLSVDTSSESGLQIIEEDIAENFTSSSPCSYVIMNLPGLAIDFLDSFRSLFVGLPPELKIPDIIEPFLPYVFCYTFSSETFSVADCQARVELAVGQPLPDSCNVRLVRNVAPKKEMMCVSFKLWPELVLAHGDDKKQEDSEPCVEPDTKRQKLSS